MVFVSTGGFFFDEVLHWNNSKFYTFKSMPLRNEIYATGDFVARAFAVGKTIKRQN